MQREIQLYIAELPAIPFAGDFDRDLVLKQRMHARIAIPVQPESLAFPGQEPVDGLSGNLSELGADCGRKLDLAEVAQPIQFGSQKGSQALTAGIVEDRPQLCQRGLDGHAIYRLAGPRATLARAGLGPQLGDQIFSSQFGPLLRFIQQPGLQRFGGSDVVGSQLRQILFP